MASNRFVGPADVLDLGRLVRENRSKLYYGLLVAIGIHLATLAYFSLTKQERVVVRPPIAELIIRRPRMTKPFEFKKRRVPKRRMTRKVASAKPRVMRTITTRINSPDIFGTIRTFDYSVDSGASMGVEVVEPDIQAAEITSSKDPEKRISMQDEFLDLASLDTGKYKAMVIQDPTDKRNIKGFVYLALAWGNDLEPDTQRAIPQLVEAVNKHTQINASVENHLFLDSRDLFKSPFVYVTENNQFELTKKEIENLGLYMRSGGFVMADNGQPTYEYGPAEAGLRGMFEDALGREARVQILPNDHPIYHSFFDFDDGPPPGGEVQETVWVLGATTQSGATSGYRMFQPKPVPYLEGIYLGDRMVGIYSDKGYGWKWEQEYENDPQLKMGVNIVVFALTQKGSIAQQQIDFYSQR